MGLLKWGLIGVLGYTTWLVGVGTNFILVDYFNLLMHEAGHLIFLMGGEVISFMGGSILQLMIPIICGITILKQQGDWFGVLMCFWWLGENLVYVGRYMADANTLALPLIGGMHDFAFLFTHWDLLDQAEVIGQFFVNLGIVVMASAVIGLVVQVVVMSRQKYGGV